MNYCSDEEYTYEEELRLQKAKQLEYLTTEDYLAYKPTRQILEDEWDNEFENTLKDKIEGEWNRMRYMCTRTTNLGDLIEDFHMHDFVDLVKYHVVPKYDKDYFMENPDSAMGLLNKLDELKNNELVRKNNDMKKKMKKADVEFNWGK